MNLNHVSELWKASLVFGPIFAMLFGVSSRALFLGFTEYHECPFAPVLPQGLICFGIIGLMASIAALILIVMSFFNVDDSGTQLWYLLFAAVAVAVYGISAILLALVIAYVLHTKHTSYGRINLNDSEPFCDPSIYNFCHNFAVIVLGLTVIFLILLVWDFSKKIYKLYNKKQSLQ